MKTTIRVALALLCGLMLSVASVPGDPGGPGSKIPGWINLPGKKGGGAFSSTEFSAKVVMGQDIRLMLHSTMRPAWGVARCSLDGQVVFWVPDGRVEIPATVYKYLMKVGVRELRLTFISAGGPIDVTIQFRAEAPTIKITAT